MLSTRDSLHTDRHTQTESEVMEKILPENKNRKNKSPGSNIYTRQNRL